jgi:serine/threonine protein kinase
VPGGELFRLLRREKLFPNDVALFYAAEVVLAVEHLHSLHIAYRDMKPENLLIGADGHLRLTDFGFAKKLIADKTYSVCGTPEYMAPEIVL